MAARKLLEGELVAEEAPRGSNMRHSWRAAGARRPDPLIHRIRSPSSQPVFHLWVFQDHPKLVQSVLRVGSTSAQKLSKIVRAIPQIINYKRNLLDNYIFFSAMFSFYYLTSKLSAGAPKGFGWIVV